MSLVIKHFNKHSRPYEPKTLIMKQKTVPLISVQLINAPAFTKQRKYEKSGTFIACIFNKQSILIKVTA